jgi:hypothetical protein
MFMNCTEDCQWHACAQALLLPPFHVVGQAVLAHELGHLKCDHGVWLTAANVLALGTVSLLPVVSSAVEEGLMRWLRAAELTCDRAALLVAQDRCGWGWGGAGAALGRRWEAGVWARVSGYGWQWAAEDDLLLYFSFPCTLNGFAAAARLSSQR